MVANTATCIFISYSISFSYRILFLLFSTVVYVLYMVSSKYLILCIVVLVYYITKIKDVIYLYDTCIDVCLLLYWLHLINLVLYYNLGVCFHATRCRLTI